MDGFPLLDLNSNNLEKVINKLKEKSYCRLQQTCHTVADFVHNSPNIAVPIGGIYYPRWNKEKSRFEMGSINFRGRYPVEVFYGFRLCLIDPEDDADVDTLCEILKKNNITCRDLALYEVEWSADDCAKLLKAVRANKVNLNSIGSDRFESVFASKYLKEVELKVGNEEDLANMAPRVLSTFSRVTIQIESCEDPYNFIRSVIDCIRSRYPKKLEFFMCSAGWTEEFPTKKQLEKELNGYIVTTGRYDNTLEFDAPLPDDFQEATLNGRFIEYEEICITYFNDDD